MSIRLSVQEPLVPNDKFTWPFSLDAHQYNVEVHFSRQTLEITFDKQTHEYTWLTEDGNTTLRFPPQDLTKADLLSGLDPLVTLPADLLELPFSRDTWREFKQCET